MRNLNKDQRKEITKKLESELLALLQKGDLLIADDVTYFEAHANPTKEVAMSLYSAFEAWAAAQNPPLEPCDKFFFKMLFQAMSELNARKRIQVRVCPGNCSLAVLLNPNTFDV